MSEEIDFQRVALAARECADVVCDVPLEPSDDEEVKGFTELTNTIWHASTVGSVDVREGGVRLGLAPARDWHECTDVERRWWMAFKDAVLAMRGSFSAPTQDHAVITPPRQKVRARDMIFEQLDGAGERSGSGDERQDSSQVIVTRPVLARNAADLPPVDDEEERRIAQAMSADEIQALPGAERARVAALRGIPSISASPAPGVTSRPPDTPMQSQVAIIRANLLGEDGKPEKVEGKAVISRPVVANRKGKGRR